MKELKSFHSQRTPLKTNRNMPKIVFLCHVSNPSVRDCLDLHQYRFRRLLYRLKGGVTLYPDFAIWVADYIEEFEKHPEFEIHIVSPHWGMKKKVQTYEKNGIIYHFFKCNNGILYTLADKLFRIEEKNDYASNRKRIKSIITSISPDMVMLCGAENPYYASSALDIKENPIYVILQTLLNDPKRIKMGVGNPYRRHIEMEIFKHAHYFNTIGEKSTEIISKVNPNAVFLPIRFPSHRPKVTIPKEKEYDFVFYAMNIGQNKGIEDVLKALALVKERKDNVRLNIIGHCNTNYKNRLDNLTTEFGLVNNVHFSGYYQQIQETFDNVVKAHAVVVPGITALNSTVRESMLIGMPTICYELPGVENFNEGKTRILSVPIGDIQGLAEQMLFVIQQLKKAKEIAIEGKLYAESTFSNEAIVNQLLDNCKKIIQKEI